MSRSLVGALALAMLLGACGTVGGVAYVRAYAAGDRELSSGRFREAAAAYEYAAAIATRGRDRDEALYAAGDARARAGDEGGALAIFDKLSAESPPGERSVRAMYRAARLRIESNESRDPADRARGYAALEKILHVAPEHGSAHASLRTLVEHVEATRGVEAALAYETSLAMAAGKSRLGEEICYDVATRKEALHDDHGALTGFLSCAERWKYPVGALFDDSLWRASLLHEKLGDVPAAIADLERLESVRESSSLNGTYNRPKMAAGQLRIAELQRDVLHDHSAARASFHRLYVEHTTAFVRPKAVYEEALLAKQDGDSGTACRLARTLLDDFGETRFARRADELCPDVAPRVAKLKNDRDSRRAKGAE